MAQHLSVRSLAVAYLRGRSHSAAATVDDNDIKGSNDVTS